MLPEGPSRPTPAELDAILDDLHRRIRLPDDAPTPEELIREARDERTRRL